MTGGGMVVIVFLGWFQGNWRTWPGQHYTLIAWLVHGIRLSKSWVGCFIERQRY